MDAEKQAILSKMAPHQVEGLKNGGMTTFEGHPYTGADFGFTPGVNASQAVDATVELAKSRDLNAQLIAENELLKAEIDKGGKVDTSDYEVFLPNSKTEIEALSLKKLKTLASIKGVTVEGEDKAAYVAALTEEKPTDPRPPVEK